jgi:DNA-directed RNA polymerase subunit F
MSQKTNAVKGYYSILQYVPDLERSEGVNIGILLLCPEKGFLKAQTAHGNDRVRRFFGPDTDLDLDRLNAYKEIFEERVEAETANIRSPEELERFIDTRGNQLRLTRPRPVKVFDPEATLQELFNTLVGGHRRRKAASESPTAELTRNFDALIERDHLEDRIERDVRIESTIFRQPLIFPVAFRNGQLNVIQPVAFEKSEERSRAHACELAVQSDELRQRQEPVQLNVLASFQPDQPESEERVRNVLEKYQVTLYTPQELDRLIEIIKTTTH